MSNHYAIILTSIPGTSLSFLSDEIPKEFLPLISKQTPLQEIVDKIIPIFPKENIYVVTDKKYEHMVKDQLGLVKILFSKSNINTLSIALTLQELDPLSIITVFTKIHHIEGEFNDVLKTSYTLANDESIAIIGTKPTRVTSGYIKLGKHIRDNIYYSLAFAESGRFGEYDKEYCWNSGIFTSKVSVLVNEYKKYQPAIYQAIIRKDLTDKWEELPGISIEKAIIEKTCHIVVISTDIICKDLGSWSILLDHLFKHSDENSILDNCTALHSDRNYVRTRKKVILYGVEDLIVVEDGGEIFICKQELIDRAMKELS